MKTVTCTCENCKISFEKISYRYNQSKKNGYRLFCSTKCKNAYFSKQIDVTCDFCGNKTKKKPWFICDKSFCSKECHNSYQKSFPNKKMNKNNYVDMTCMECFLTFSLPQQRVNQGVGKFCSRSCASKNYNRNKKSGYRRSKLETYIENNIPLLYPDLTIHFNDRTTIGLELDIYIPSLFLAFELNGPVHYIPIYGQDVLSRMQLNDKKRYQLCQLNKIDICIIDISSQRRFSEKFGKKILDHISNIIINRVV